MIISIKSIYDYITTWIRTLLESNKTKTALCVVTGGIDSCLNAALTLRSTSHIPTVLIFMGFKPENEAIFESWVVKNFSAEKYKIIKPQHPTINDPELSNVDIRTSIIPTYVDMYAKINNSMTFGAITRSEYNLVKFFKTRVDEIYDYYPIIDLYKKEAIELANYIGLPSSIVSSKSLTEESFGFTYDELEWLDRENDNLQIVAASDLPNLAPHWGLFNERKKLLLIKVYQMNKNNKTKIISDNKKCLVRKALPGCIN